MYRKPAKFDVSVRKGGSPLTIVRDYASHAQVYGKVQHNLGLKGATGGNHPTISWAYNECKRGAFFLDIPFVCCQEKEGCPLKGAFLLCLQEGIHYTFHTDAEGEKVIVMPDAEVFLMIFLQGMCANHDSENIHKERLTGRQFQNMLRKIPSDDPKPVYLRINRYAELKQACPGMSPFSHRDNINVHLPNRNAIATHKWRSKVTTSGMYIHKTLIHALMGHSFLLK